MSAINVNSVSPESGTNISLGGTSVKIPTASSAPTSPSEGDMYFDTTLKQTRVYGTVWSKASEEFIASGGTEVSSGGFKYHTFTTSGNFTVTSGNNTAEYIVVAGGGAGGRMRGGGGGAGGLVYNSSFSVSAGTYAVTIGAGGAGGSGIGADGNNSVFGSSTAIGGGGGGGHNVNDYHKYPGRSGGSGGGGQYQANNGSTSAGGSGTSGQGFAGGTAGPTNYCGGGGGGASEVGANTSSGVGGAGGDGLNTYSDWATATSTGDSGYYAGGGGGGSNVSSTRAAGGQGGGGAGGAESGSAPDGLDGTANTGGGGGGGKYDTLGKSGGSGIVIIRYPVQEINMAHFAKVINGVVNKVIVAEPEFFNEFVDTSPGDWLETSYNGSIRKNFAGIGFTYDKDRDAFISPKPFASWILNEDTCNWEAPVPYPADSNEYTWNEETQSWELIDGQ